MSEYRLQAERPPLLLHSTGPRPPDRAIGPAGLSSYTVPGSGLGPARDRTHRSTGTCWPSQSGRLQVRLPPLLLHRHGTGPPKHWRVLSHRSTGAYRPSQSERLHAGRPPLLTGLLHRTGPPKDRAIGPAGHYTDSGHGPGRHHDQTHRSPGARGPCLAG